MSGYLILTVGMALSVEDWLTFIIELVFFWGGDTFTQQCYFGDVHTFTRQCYIGDVHTFTQQCYIGEGKHGIML